MTKRHDWTQFIDAVRDEMGFLPRSLRTRIAVTFCFLALAVSIPEYFYVSHIYLGQLTTDKREKLQIFANSAATIVGQSLSERSREVANLAQLGVLKTAALNGAEVKTSLEQLKQSRTHYSWIGIADPDGVVQSSTSDLLKGVSVKERPWFKNGQARVSVGDLHEAVLLANLLNSDGAGQPMRFIDFSSPILSPEGKLRGVIGAHAHWAWANEIMSVVGEESLRKDSAEIFIVDGRNTIIYPPDGADAQHVPSQVAGAQPFQSWGDGAEFLTVFAKVPEHTSEKSLNWKIYVRQPKAVVVDIVANLQVVELLTSLVAGIAFLLFSWISADRIARPLEKLTGIARRIQSGEEEQKFDVDVKSREIQGLQLALSAMSTTLMDRKRALEKNNIELEDKVRQRTHELEEANRALEQLAKHDALTGLPNRLAANERLRQEFSRIKRGKGVYVVLMVDIDHFKRINDTWGHATGDVVLKRVANLIRGALRDTDFVGRIGGEEFLVILPMTDHGTALHVAEKIRVLVASSPMDLVGHVTVSIGAEEARIDQGDEHEAVRGADEWLYQAKKLGRNRVGST